MKFIALTVTGFSLAFLVNVTRAAPSNSTTANKQPLNGVCDPKLNECGQFAICINKFPCKKGRCECLSLRFRPELADVAVNCVPILPEGAVCTDAQRPFLPDGASCVRVNETTRVVQCGSDVASSKDGFCKTAPPRFFIGNLGEPCDGNKKVCDTTLGLRCNATIQKCVCLQNLVPQLDKVSCATAKYGDKCGIIDECNADKSKSYNCSATEKVCRCSMNYTLITTAELSNDKVVYVAKPSCFSGNATLKQGDNCTVPALGADNSTPTNTTFCSSGLACISCPEDSIPTEAKGKCRSLTDNPVTTTSGATTFDTPIVLIVGILALTSAK